ncbi:MoaD/ThiS family protein [Motilibacter deserti]|uniref:MoaD/ThiS family protein n=1 Tax=Motilibacter deserti TaxID=2714956 RepID=A0ABX0GVK4_9ACTN|nr:MoaD/ThiS family protein [Motilibacter deserti]
MAQVTVRYWAAAKAAAGRVEDVVDAGTVADALEQAGRAHGERLRAVLGAASFLVDGVRVSREAAPGRVLADGAVVEVLPPFAGG